MEQICLFWLPVHAHHKWRGRKVVLKKHFILIKIWNKSWHPKVAPTHVGYTGPSVLAVLTIWNGFSLVHSTSSCCWHGLPPECASETGGGSKSRWHWAGFANPLPLEEIFCASKHLLLLLWACSSATLHGHPNQGPVDLPPNRPRCGWGHRGSHGWQNRGFVMNEAELCSKIFRDTGASPQRGRGLISIEKWRLKINVEQLLRSLCTRQGHF